MPLGSIFYKGPIRDTDENADADADMRAEIRLTDRSDTYVLLIYSAVSTLVDDVIWLLFRIHIRLNQFNIIYSGVIVHS